MTADTSDAAPAIAVGDRVFLPLLLEPGHPAYELSYAVTAEPGVVRSIDEGGWAMVDRGRWGIFGVDVGQLRPAG